MLDLKTGKTGGVYRTDDGKDCQFEKTNFWKSHYEWKDHNSLLGSAVPKTKLSRAFLINYQGNGYGLFPGGSKLRSWNIKDSSSQILCEFKTRGAFKRGAIIQIGAEIPIGLLVFGYCLVSKRWQEQSS